MAEAPDLASWIVVGGIAGLCYGWFCTRAGFSGAAPLLEAVGWDQSGKRAPWPSSRPAPLGDRDRRRARRGDR